jgi:hypothetical protein
VPLQHHPLMNINSMRTARLVNRGNYSLFYLFQHAYPSLNSTPQTPVINPSTPPPTYGSTNEPALNVNNAYIPQSNPMGPQHPSNNDMPPPPSYSDAVNCPAPPYLPYGTPKPAHMNGPQGGNPIYPPPISGTGYVLQAPTSQSSGMPAPQVLSTTIIATLPGPNSCVHCYGGEVHNETDLCCLLCLILFAIFTFPMGLILLCCIPCTTRRRCIRCRRLN